MIASTSKCGRANTQWIPKYDMNLGNIAHMLTNKLA